MSSLEIDSHDNQEEGMAGCSNTLNSCIENNFSNQPDEIDGWIPVKRKNKKKL